MNSCIQCKSINAEIDVVLLIVVGGGAYTWVIWGKRPPGFWAQVHVQNEGTHTCAGTVYIYIYIYIYIYNHTYNKE